LCGAVFPLTARVPRQTSSRRLRMAPRAQGARHPEPYPPSLRVGFDHARVSAHACSDLLEAHRTHLCARGGAPGGLAPDGALARVLTAHAQDRCRRLGSDFVAEYLLT